MAEIYTNKEGLQVYDYNGKTYSVKTGEVITATSTAPTSSPTSTPTATYVKIGEAYFQKSASGLFRLLQQ